MIGEKLSHYTVLEEIHRGEKQVVYRARDERLHREVALKVLPADLVSDPARRRRFVTEAKAAAALEHPYIGVVHEIDEAGGIAFIAMELLRGPSLADRLAGGPLPIAEALEVATGVGAALAYAHERGIVHRDLKPANVVFTDTGHPKLIDFGLAKLLDVEYSPFLGEAGEAEAPLESATREGLIAGTVAFMSPEQARGGKVDARSDVFSFGLLLYTLLAGAPPFTGASRIDTLHDILREPTPKLPGLGAEARQSLQPIVERCLEKEPDRRYPSLAEVLEDLKRAQRRLEAGGLGRAGRYGVAAGLAIFLLGVGAALLFRGGETPPAAPEKPTLAVLHFENLSGDPDLDWLRTGLTDMLITDLAQSPEIEVLGTDQLYQVLEDMGRTSSAMMPADAVSELARRTGVDKVLVGSFARSGDAFRLSARLQDANTGRVLFSEKAEATGEANIFPLVDEITRRIEIDFGLTSPEGGLDRDLRDVSTASVDAYREYAEGIRLHERFREEEAIPHFQRAVELDPGFAMALAKLGIVLSNLGRHEEADLYAERALEHVDRLSARERYYIEGWYYSRSPDTLSRAIESYRKAIDVYPDHGSARHNLGNLLFSIEIYDEAIDVLEELRRRRMLFPATYEQLAIAYKNMGDVGRGLEVLREYHRRNPEDWTTLVTAAKIRIETGEIDRGLAVLAQAEALGATPLKTAPVRWEAEILLDDWEEALATAERLVEAGGPLEKLYGGRLFATTELYRGEVGRVLRSTERTLSESSSPPSSKDPVRLFEAKLLLDTGDDARALATALALQESDERYEVGPSAMVVAALAARRLGDVEQSDALVREYAATAATGLGPAPDRLHQFLLGEVALQEGRSQEAIRHLNEAESMLAPRGADGTHTLIWYSLATAHLEAGNLDEAASWYERIVGSSEERLFEPLRYVRSFYFLGRLHEADGELERAREDYARFLDHWEDGSVDRERVREAREKLVSLAP